MGLCIAHAKHSRVSSLRTENGLPRWSPRPRRGVDPPSSRHRPTAAWPAARPVPMPRGRPTTSLLPGPWLVRLRCGAAPASRRRRRQESKAPALRTRARFPAASRGCCLCQAIQSTDGRGSVGCHGSVAQRDRISGKAQTNRHRSTRGDCFVAAANAPADGRSWHHLRLPGRPSPCRAFATTAASSRPPRPACCQQGCA